MGSVLCPASNVSVHIKRAKSIELFSVYCMTDSSHTALHFVLREKEISPVKTRTGCTGY